MSLRLEGEKLRVILYSKQAQSARFTWGELASDPMAGEELARVSQLAQAYYLRFQPRVAGGLDVLLAVRIVSPRNFLPIPEIMPVAVQCNLRFVINPNRRATGIVLRDGQVRRFDFRDLPRMTARNFFFRRFA